MVSAQITNIEIAFPSVAVSVNFSDDASKLPQPQVQTFHIPIESEDGQALSADTLLEKIQGYINDYETMLAKIEELQAEINKRIDSSSTAADVAVAPTQETIK
jgi:hypothetical protein